MSLIPPLTGGSIRLNFRADHVTLDDIEKHMRRLEAMAPGCAITLSDTLRSLVQEGAKSFRKKLRDQDISPADESDNDQ
jgi:hypothetical protein